jgi:hypothetical protein
MRALALAALAACSTAEDRPSDWGYVYPAIIRPSCATAMCHSKLGSQAGLDLSTSAAAYVAFTGRVCHAPELPGEPEGNLVVPGHPATSQLVHILRGEGGRVMPPDVPLPDAEIEVIVNWILDGAECD